MSTLPTVARRHPLLAFAPDAPDWEGAACVNADPELWFKDDETSERSRTDTAIAQFICYEDCPIRERCLEWAVQQAIPYGVWGGKTTAERRAGERRHCETCEQPLPGTKSKARYCEHCRWLARSQRNRKYHQKRKKAI